MAISASSVTAEIVQGKFMGHPVVLLDVCYGEVTQTERVKGFVPNPSWTYKDKLGHDHRAELVDDVVQYPTLRLNVNEPAWCSDCQDVHEDRWYSCKRCGENISPSVKFDVRQVTISVTHTIDFTMLFSEFHRHAAVDGSIVVKHDTTWDVEADGRIWRCVINNVYQSPDDSKIKLNGRLV